MGFASCKPADTLVMAAVWNRAMFLPCGFFYLLSFFPRLMSAIADWLSIPYFYTWCGLSANLGCRSEMCCTLLAGNAGVQDAKMTQKIAISAPPQRCNSQTSSRGATQDIAGMHHISFTARHCSMGVGQTLRR